jgi:hypothetical protein
MLAVGKGPRYTQAKHTMIASLIRYLHSFEWLNSIFIGSTFLFIRFQEIGGRSECEIEGRGSDDQQGRGPDQVEVDSAPPQDFQSKLAVDDDGN